MRWLIEYAGLEPKGNKAVDTALEPLLELS
jgi:hypothetical protein